jgi:drug/metabolite transporter (DMT)-like permease
LNKHITKNHLLLHLIVFIWGWAPIFGKQITLEALQLVWFRIGITIIAIAAYNVLIRQKFTISKKDYALLLLTGAVIAFHWFCFYHAIKVSNVSITLAAFATGTFFTSITEPLFYKRKILWYEMLFGLLIIAAIGFIFNIETENKLGILFGVLAALTSSLFTVWNGLFIRRIEAPVISLVELCGGFVALSIYLLFTNEFTESFFQVSNNDWFFITFFSLVGTAFPYVASTNLLKKISPFTVTLTVNLETIYGIIFAFLIWRESEQMTMSFYLATLFILLIIIVNAIVKARLKSKSSLQIN